MRKTEWPESSRRLYYHAALQPSDIALMYGAELDFDFDRIRFYSSDFWVSFGGGAKPLPGGE